MLHTAGLHLRLLGLRLTHLVQLLDAPFRCYVGAEVEEADEKKLHHQKNAAWAIFLFSMFQVDTSIPS